MASRLVLLLFGVASLRSAAATEGQQGWGCEGADFSKFCPKICTKGLGRKAGAASSDCDGGWISTLGACGAHSIKTTNDWNQAQGEYPQKCMQEYCKRGLKGGGSGGGGGGGGDGPSKKEQRKQKKQEKKEQKGRRRSDYSWYSLLAKRRVVQQHNASWGWGGGAYFKPPKGNTDQNKKGAETPGYYCDQLCSNMYHPVMGNQMGQHPGTAGCTTSHCNTQDKCNKDCNDNWEKGMKPIYDDFCACPDARYAPNLLELEAGTEEHPPAEAESVDVGAFIQTSISDKKAEEL